MCTMYYDGEKRYVIYEMVFDSKVHKQLVDNANHMGLRVRDYIGQLLEEWFVKDVREKEGVP